MKLGALGGSRRLMIALLSALWPAVSVTVMARVRATAEVMMSRRVVPTLAALSSCVD